MTEPSQGASPVWVGDVADMFARPFWAAGDELAREKIGAGWRQAMLGYQLDLASYDQVKAAGPVVYEHLASRAMPLTADVSQMWPEAALGRLRDWIAAGCPEATGDQVTQRSVTPSADLVSAARLRRDILDLNDSELATYRAAVERLGASALTGPTVWEQLALVHTNWCLHYQEAFTLWHRANLLWAERLLGVAIPYWNFMSPDAALDGRAGSGIPQAFKDLTYIHPETGETRPNPLRFAVAKDGESKACRSGATTGVDCRYVQRDPVLYTSGEEMREERRAKLAQVTHFQWQVTTALRWPVFSSPEGTPGYPWANILTFSPTPPDSDYPHRTDFDGLYEQPHDNFHGWIGPDMADNAYTAFDPIFLSYHANVDRIFEDWKRAHPAAMFTAGFPLRPFVGPTSGRIDPAGRELWNYTTIGDMARDSRALGYDYQPPPVPDAQGAPPVVAAPTAGTQDAHLYVLFPGVRCVLDSYHLDVFVDLPRPQPADVHGPHFVGRMTRLGMGVQDDKGRCVARGVTRILDATHNVHALKLQPGSAVPVTLIVTDITTGGDVPESVYDALPGFVPHAQWGAAMPATPDPAVREDSDSCH